MTWGYWGLRKGSLWKHLTPKKSLSWSSSFPVPAALLSTSFLLSTEFSFIYSPYFEAGTFVTSFCLIRKLRLRGMKWSGTQMQVCLLPKPDTLTTTLLWSSSSRLWMWQHGMPLTDKSALESGLSQDLSASWLLRPDIVWFLGCCFCFIP